jgi:hypothetical protein
MRNIWAFGDSAIDRRIRLRYDMPQHETWIETVAKELGAEIKDFSWGASSLSYLYFHYREQFKNMEKGDIVILSLPYYDKSWFFKKSPTMSTAARVCANNYFSDKQKDFITTYFDEIFCMDEEINTLANFLDMLCYHQEKKGLNIIAFGAGIGINDTLTIPKELSGGIGSLWEGVSFGEIIEGEDAYINLFNSVVQGAVTDTRLNHMSESNHPIMAKKIINSIRTKEPIDFTTDFLKNIVSVKDLTGPTNE